jgi:hypothetical protein
MEKSKSQPPPNGQVRLDICHCQFTRVINVDKFQAGTKGKKVNIGFHESIFFTFDDDKSHESFPYFRPTFRSNFRNIDFDLDVERGIQISVSI